MKISLVALNAKYIHSSLSVRSIAAYALKHMPDGEFHICEHTINENIRDVFRDLYRQNADLYGFSCYIWNIHAVRELAMLLKKALPKALIVLGGPEAYGNGMRLITDFRYADYILVGEGERSFTELVLAMRDHREMRTVPGLIFRGADNKVCQTESPQPLSMDELPFPYRDSDMKEFEHKLLYYETSRGCPFGCSYCMSSVDKTVRFRDLALVKKEIRFFIRHRVPIVKFVDRTFNCEPSRTSELFRFIIDQKGETLFHCEISADILTDEIIDILASAPPGLFQFEIGIQSTSPETLRAVHRNPHISECLKNIQALVRLGNIKIHVDLIAGLPGDAPETLIRSFNETYSLGADVIQLGFLKVLPGSPMEQEVTRYGLVYSELPPYEIVKTDRMSVDDLLRMKQVEKMLDLYYNSKRFRNSLPVALTCFEDAYALFRTLSETIDCPVSHPELCKLLWNVCGEREDLRFPLALDYLLANRGKELPEYLRQPPIEELKARIREFIRSQRKENVRDAMKHLYFAGIEGRVIQIDYASMEWCDITDDFPQLSS